MLFKRNRKKLQDVENKVSSIEVIEIKRKANMTVDQANRDIKKLNRLLKANGITLKIHIASHGENNV